MSAERAVVFACEGESLAAVLHIPQQSRDVGVLIVVGGPQYRVGSHRQFVLLARDLAANGFATCRFDYRGIGDSSGPLRGFEHVHDDIRIAVDEFIACVPTIKKVVLWGLCDGATASSFYAQHDPRIAGLVLLNPWVRSQQTLARSLVFHYYVSRFANVAAWKKMFTDRNALRAALSSFTRALREAFAKPTASKQSPLESREPPATIMSSPAAAAVVPSSKPLVPRMAEALRLFNGEILLILSGADITANEFNEGVRGHRSLRRRLAEPSVAQFRLREADHTFSRAEWRDAVSRRTVEWLISQLN